MPVLGDYHNPPVLAGDASHHREEIFSPLCGSKLKTFVILSDQGFDGQDSRLEQSGNTGLRQ
jgi:hypothetical protein